MKHPPKLPLRRIENGHVVALPGPPRRDNATDSRPWTLMPERKAA